MQSLGDDFEAAFEMFDGLLCDHETLWSERPFTRREVSWKNSHQALHRWALELSDEQLHELEANPLLLLPALGRQLESFAKAPAFELLMTDAQAANQWPLRGVHSSHGFPEDFSREIKGRKWDQVRAFAAAARPTGLPILDWCAGKGHLARALAYRWSRPAICLEHNSQLCTTGQRLARRLRLPVLHDNLDVFSRAAEEYFAHPYHAVALHACGGLHLRLLDLCVRYKLPALSVSPCCYGAYLDGDASGAGCDTRPVRSTFASRSPLRLDAQKLRLAVQETVVAPARIQRQRLREQCWRLGFDLLQRESTGVDTYRPLPSVRPVLLNSGFEKFCTWGAQRIGISLPRRAELDAYRRAGEQRQATVARLGLVRHGFRRALEFWLVLDRTLFLQAAGYKVGLYQFCAKSASPRNLLIEARAN